MKTFSLTILIAILLVSSAFAAPTKKVTSVVKYSFENAFPGATNVEWKVTDQYTKAAFVVNNVRTEAFYDSRGAFVGSSHATSIDKLPVNVKRSFAKKYASYIVTEAIEFEGVEETAYYISAKNEKESMILKIVDGNISTFNPTGN